MISAGDSRVKIPTQPNSGKPSIARNKGLEVAKGESICFLDGDDLYHPQKLEKSIEVFRRYPDIDVVFHDIKFIDKKGVEQDFTYLGAVNFADRVLSKSKEIGESLYLCDEKALFFFMCTKVTTIYTSAVAIRRNRLAAERVFFPEDLTLGEDVDLWFRLVKTGRVAYIDRPLSYYRIHPSSLDSHVSFLS